MPKETELIGFANRWSDEKPLRYRRARNLSMKHWPKNYPSEIFYIVDVFLSIGNQWTYPTYSHIVPHKKYWQELAKGILREKKNLDFYRKIIKSLSPERTAILTREIEKYNLVAPLLEQGKLEEAGNALFEYEKELGKQRKDTDPGLKHTEFYPDNVVILYLPKDLERSWKKAAIIAYNYALNHKDIDPEFKKQLIEKASWLIK